MLRAAINGHLKIVEILLSNGATVDSRDDVSTYNNVMSLGYRTYRIMQIVHGGQLSRLQRLIEFHGKTFTVHYAIHY